MTITDILLYEMGSGGDMILRGGDLATVSGYENAPYLAMFGGNNWWGNYDLPAENQFLSQTETALRTNALTSGGRKNIERAINADLSFLDNIPNTTWSVSTAITAPNRWEASITINGQTFSLEWNPDIMYLTYKVA